MATAPEHPYVSRREGICGGRAAITGTRIAVWQIALRYRAGASIEDLLDEFPHLNPAQLFDALSYGHDHAGELDTDLAENRQTTRVLVPAGARASSRKR